MPSDVPSLRSRRPRRQNMNSRMDYFMSIPTGRGFLYKWSKMDSTQTFFKKKTRIFKNFDTFQRMSRREHSTPIPTGRGFLYKCPQLGRKSQEFRCRLICGRDFSWAVQIGQFNTGHVSYINDWKRTKLTHTFQKHNNIQGFRQNSKDVACLAFLEDYKGILGISPDIHSTLNINGQNSDTSRKISKNFVGDWFVAEILVGHFRLDISMLATFPI